MGSPASIARQHLPVSLTSVVRTLAAHSLAWLVVAEPNSCTRGGRPSAVSRAKLSSFAFGSRSWWMACRGIGTFVAIRYRCQMGGGGGGGMIPGLPK